MKNEEFSAFLVMLSGSETSPICASVQGIMQC